MISNRVLFDRFLQHCNWCQNSVLVGLCDVSVHDHLVQDHVSFVYIEHDLWRHHGQGLVTEINRLQDGCQPIQNSSQDRKSYILTMPKPHPHLFLFITITSRTVIDIPRRLTTTSIYLATNIPKLTISQSKYKHNVFLSPPNTHVQSS